ncbi:MAG TPA: TIGR00282 family metallophosphoesterase [Bacillales bacterium]|nr:TIGR00282 family metallophosphoesterase [Bacillales bacterium]
MKVLFIGDVVGRPGRRILDDYLPKLKQKYQPTLTIVNGENAAGGKGITETIYKKFLDLGAQVVTLGNHVWDNREVFEFIDDAPWLIRPANFPSGTPGKGLTFVKINDVQVAVVNLQGRTFMAPLESPFTTADALIEQARKKTPIVIVDFHAETTSEKQALGWYLDGRVTAVIGTHTHVQTADERILPKGTAYLSDAGMTGPRDGIIGMDRDAVMKKFLTHLPVRFEVASGREQLNGVLIEVDRSSGTAKSIQRIAITDEQPFFE